jgi:hypothetical protein
VTQPIVAAQIIGNGQAKRLAAEFPRDVDIDSLRRGIGVNPFRVSSRFTQEGATGALGSGRHVAVETRHPGDDDLVAIRFEHAISDAATNRGDEAGNRRPASFVGDTEEVR